MLARKSWHVNNAPTHPRCVTPILPTLALPDAALYRNGGGWFPQPVGHKGETPCSNVSGCTPLDGTAAATPETGIGVCGAKRAEFAQNSCTPRLPKPHYYNLLWYNIGPARRGFILATLYHISTAPRLHARIRVLRKRNSITLRCRHGQPPQTNKPIPPPYPHHDRYSGEKPRLPAAINTLRRPHT